MAVVPLNPFSKSQKLLLLLVEVLYLCKHAYSCSLAETTTTSIKMSSTAALVIDRIRNKHIRIFKRIMSRSCRIHSQTTPLMGSKNSRVRQPLQLPVGVAGAAGVIIGVAVGSHSGDSVNISGHTLTFDNSYRSHFQG